MKDHRNIAEYALRVVVMINENAITLVMWKEYGKGKEFGG